MVIWNAKVEIRFVTWLSNERLTKLQLLMKTAESGRIHWGDPLVGFKQFLLKAKIHVHQQAVQLIGSLGVHVLSYNLVSEVYLVRNTNLELRAKKVTMLAATLLATQCSTLDFTLSSELGASTVSVLKLAFQS